MAGDWIKLRTNLATDPAVKFLARELRESVHTIVGRLHALWSWADQHTDDGTLPFTVLDDIDDVVEKRGFAEKMKKIGWLLSAGTTGVEIPNWHRHNGKSAKKRCLDSEAQRRKRETHSDENRKMSENDSDKIRQNPDQRREEYTPIVPLTGDDARTADAAEPEPDHPKSALDNPLLLRARAIFRMRADTGLDAGQLRAYRRAHALLAATTDDEWARLEAYYAADLPRRSDYRRRDLATLLNNWSGEITRSADWAIRTGFTSAENPQKNKNGGPPDDIWRAALSALYPDTDPATMPYRTWGDIPASLQAEILAAISLSEEDAA